MRRDAQVRNSKTCIVCNASYVRGHRTKEQWAVAHFCSVSCSIKSKIGVPRPDAAAISASHLKHFRGARHWNWKGGITPKLHALRHSPKYNEWRKAVYRRDYWTCQICHEKQKHPIAHHIFDFRSYPAKRYEVDNGQTLCRPCHKSVHSQIGMNTRYQPVQMH